MSTTTIIQPGQIEETAGAITRLRLPHAPLFADRATRCRNLAKDHPFAGYLNFCAAIAAQQQRELHQFPHLPLPDDKLLHHCQEYNMPPLSPAGWPPHPHWQEVVHRLIKAAEPELPPAGQQELHRCPINDSNWLDSQKTQLLRGNYPQVDPALAPFLGAALQVQWSSLAARLPPTSMTRATEQPLCPVCGSHPVAAFLCTSGPSKGLRYLHCSLCDASWHMVRAKCSNCGNTRDIDYFSFSDHLPHIQAETCPACQSYIKLIRMEKAADADPIAEDLASLALDLHMEGKNFAKTAINLFLLPREGKN